VLGEARAKIEAEPQIWACVAGREFESPGEGDDPRQARWNIAGRDSSPFLARNLKTFWTYFAGDRRAKPSEGA
ncbi:hypothetical protein A2U01_0085658, partial [Trifolium medium]|nr:hypothetical protein [Trifolium medium]